MRPFRDRLGLPPSHGEPRVRLPNRSSLRSALLVVAGLACCAGAASAEPDTRTLATVDREVRLQPPWMRLDAMGGLVLSVRDEYTELNLWDFGGISLGMVDDQDSTSLDLWLDRDGCTLDRKAQGVDREVSRCRNLDAAGQTILRFGSGAVGLGAGTLSLRRGLPFADQEHTVQQVTQAVLQPVAAGHLWKGVRWGLTGIFGSENSDMIWMRDQVTGGRVKLTKDGEQLMPPDLFSPDQIGVSISGLGGALGYAHERWGEMGFYYRQRREVLEWKQLATRSVYELRQPRHWTEFGVGATVKPHRLVDVALMAGREYYSDTQTYRFSLSGGSNADPLAVRGDKLLEDVRHDFFQARVQGDLSRLPVTYGASVRVVYDRARQNPAAAMENDFNNFVLSEAAGDTVAGPPLVRALRSDGRTLDWGLGGSYRFLEERALAGAEFHSYRTATDGTDLLARTTRWEVRAGGEYLFDERWSGRAGYRHTRGDEDTDTERNEMVADRFSLGATARDLLPGWVLIAELYREWHRTDYPDPGELGGTSTGFGLQLARGF